MLIEHRGEVEFDFRHLLHSSFRSVVLDDVEEAMRLARQLLRDLRSRFAARVADRDPLSVEAIYIASLWSAWTGEKHPLLPDSSEQQLSEAEIRLADMALENMNRR